MSLTIIPIPAFNDNYLWLLCSGKHAVVVDPGDAAPVQAYLDKHNLSLDAILITHHHHDHTGGITSLVAQHHCPVYGPSTIKGVDHPLNDGDSFSLKCLAQTFHVSAVPGHTLDHIAYYNGKQLFCGDTLFSAGCGRMFEGTAELFYASLQKLAALPATTEIYCTHEYTLANLSFAQCVEPDNNHLKEYSKKIHHLQQQSVPSLPTSLTIERQVNPFLRCDQPAVINYTKLHSPAPVITPIDVFRVLRNCKDKHKT